MKYFYITFLFLTKILVSQVKNNYSIKGYINGLKHGTIYLIKYDNNHNRLIDSVL